MSIIRVKKSKDNPYAMINKSFLNHTEMSWKAKGMLTYLLAKPDDWVVRTTDLINKSTDGKHAVTQALKELEQKGYLHREMKREAGRFAEYETIVYENPMFNPHYTVPEKHAPVNSTTAE